MIGEIGTEFRLYDQLTRNLSKSFSRQYVIEKKRHACTAGRNNADLPSAWRIGMKKLITKSAG